MSPVRLIATDLDGTLLNSAGLISRRTRLALGAARDAGLHVVFVSARPARDVKLIADDLGFTGMAVCANGAVAYDIETDHILSNQRLPQAVALDLILAMRALHPEVCFATEYGRVLGYEPAFPVFDGWQYPDPPLIAGAAELCGEELTKLMVHHPVHAVEILAGHVRDHVGERASVTWSGAPFVEVQAPAVSKAWGLASLCERLGVTADQVVAFGDMPNDAPMLSFAGRGVAVANAHPEAVAASDEVTASNDDDGVARVIERVLAAQATS